MPVSTQGFFAQLLADELKAVYTPVDYGASITVNWDEIDGMGYVKPPSTWVLIGPCRCVNVTVKALCVRFEGRDHWVPRSQTNVEESEVHRPGDEGVLIVREWVAKEKGWL